VFSKKQEFAGEANIGKPREQRLNANGGDRKKVSDE